MCNRLHMLHTARLLADSVWCESLAHAARTLTQSMRTKKRRARICVLGLGSGVTAIAAAQTGADIFWTDRVARFARVAGELCRRNDVSHRVKVVVSSEWDDLREPSEGRFDCVATEEVKLDI